MFECVPFGVHFDRKLLTRFAPKKDQINHSFANDLFIFPISVYSFFELPLFLRIFTTLDTF